MTVEALYPPIHPYATHRVEVDAPHVLYVEECGNPDGIPVVFLHGGPGGGTKPVQRQTFDPARYRIVLFDQRGCGRSTPAAELDGNKTSALVADIERIRETLGIEDWMVAGGSWGSLLALTYAIAHPGRCRALRLHGIFMGRPQEVNAWFEGIGRLFPDAYEGFAAHVPEAERGDLLAAYHARLTDPDPEVHMPAALSLRGFSARTQTFLPSPAHVGALTAPGSVLQVGRLFTQYCANGFFLPENHVLENVDRFRHIPAEIVQGRYDVVTPMRTAWDLHRAWPEARFTLVPLANHVVSPDAPALSTALRDASDRLADGPDAVPIETFLAPRAHHSPALSDDGAVLAWLSDETGLDQLWSRDMADPDTPPVQRTSLPEKVGALAFRPGARDILYTTDSGGDERHQLHLLRDGAEAAEPLTERPDRVHAWGCFDPEGRRIAYSVNDADPAAMRIRIRDLETGEDQVVVEGPGWRTPRSFTPDGAYLLVEDDRAGMFDASLRLLSLADGNERVLLASGEDRGAHVNATRWIEEGGALLLATDAGTEFHGLARIETATGALSWLAQPPGDVEAMAVDKATGRIALAWNEGGYSRLTLLDGKEQSDLPLPEPGRVGALAFVSQGTALIASLAGFRAPSRVIRLDLAAAATTLCADRHRLAETDTVAPEIVAIESFDGADIPAFVFAPRAPPPPGGRPALVIVHGGPESQYAAHWRSDVQHLARRGWLVVAPNVRGSTGYGRDWQAGDDLDRRMDAVRDLKAVRDWVAARDDVDEGRLVVSGQSYGGFMVLAAITEYPDDWRAAVDFYGIADFTTLLAATGPWRRRLRAVEYGDPGAEEGRALLARLSPFRKIDAVKTPLFLAHGGDDPRVSPAESELVYAALRGRGHDCELLRIDHEGHGFARAENRRAVYGAMMRFIESRTRV